MTINLAERFKTWWDNTATADERAKLAVIAKDGSLPITGGLLDTLMQNGVALVGSRWFESDERGYNFHLTSGMRDIILKPDK